MELYHGCGLLPMAKSLLNVDLKQITSITKR